jgi:tetrahydromethanopterin S-methyltransferase subunit D
MIDSRRNTLLAAVVVAAVAIDLGVRFMPVAHADPAPAAAKCEYVEGPGGIVSQKMMKGLTDALPPAIHTDAQHVIAVPMTAQGTITGVAVCSW